MKSGTYKVSFQVDLSNCADEEEAHQEIARMCSEMIEDDLFPEVELELIEEVDLEYNTEEDELQELSF